MDDYAPPFTPAERAAAWASDPRFGFRHGPPDYFFAGDDALQFDITSNANLTVVITGAMLTLGGTVVPFRFQVQTTSQQASFDTFRQSVDSGWLLHIQAKLGSAGGPGTKCVVYLRACRGLTSNALQLATLASGWVTSLHDVHWPWGTSDQPTDHAGVVVTESVANPAAGADWTFSVPTGLRFNVIAVCATLTTSAAVANRLPRLIVDNNEASPFFEAASVVAETAGIAWVNTWAAGANGVVTTDPLVVQASLPSPLLVTGGQRVRAVTGALQAADQWSGIRLQCQEWIDFNQ